MLTDSQILTKINELASKNRYILTKHAIEQMINRNMNTDDVHDVLINCHAILRKDEHEINGQLYYTYKIKGGQNDHRLAVKIKQTKSSELIIIITVMDNQAK